MGSLLAGNELSIKYWFHGLCKGFDSELKTLILDHCISKIVWQA